MDVIGLAWSYLSKLASVTSTNGKQHKEGSAVRKPIPSLWRIGIITVSFGEIRLLDIINLPTFHLICLSQIILMLTLTPGAVHSHPFLWGKLWKRGYIFTQFTTTAVQIAADKALKLGACLLIPKISFFFSTNLSVYISYIPSSVPP